MNLPTQAQDVFGGKLCVAGIINLTPDSFFSKSRTPGLNEAMGAAFAALEAGAHMLDLGAESSRPGFVALSDEEEAERLMPFIETLIAARPGTVFSVDTYHAATAARVLGMGAAMINDISACGRSPELVDVLVQHKPLYVLMHGDNPQTDTPGGPVIERVMGFFEKHLARLVKAGLPESRIVLDPGIGFGKTNRDSASLLQNVNYLHGLGRPLYVGLSMKSLFGDMLGLAMPQRALASHVAVALLAGQGVQFHRVHDVAAALQAIAVADLLGKGYTHAWEAM